MSPLVLWPAVLGLVFLAAGLFNYRRDLFAPAESGLTRLVALGPVFIAAALATFSGEHFTDAREIVQLVPKYLPLRVPIVYFVGVGMLLAAVSFVARKCLRCSAPLLALMFALFVALIYLPSTFRHPGNHVAWIFPFREGSYALGAFCVFVYETRRRSVGFALFMRLWTAGVAIFYGMLNILYPQFSPGVPDPKPTSAWVPAPHLVAYAVGTILIVLGLAILVKKTTVGAITGVGILMTALTVVLFVPDLFLAHDVPQRIDAINFVADTLLFAGTMFVIARAVAAQCATRADDVSSTLPSAVTKVIGN